MSELITGTELAARTGFSRPTLMKYAAANKIPSRERDGKTMFEPEAAEQAILKLGLKPRQKKASDEEPQSEEAEAGEGGPPEVPGALSSAVDEALRNARTAFMDTLHDHIDRAIEAKDGNTELSLLRLYYRSGDVFDAVKNELTGE